MAKSEPTLTLVAYDSDGALLADLVLPSGVTAATIADAVLVVRVPTSMHLNDRQQLANVLRAAFVTSDRAPFVVVVDDSVTLWRLVSNKPEVESPDDH